jgi:ribonuclease HI
LAKKYYVVWEGKETGVFSDWETCRSQVYGFPGAKYKGFATQNEAEAAFRSNARSTITRDSPSKDKAPTKVASGNAVKSYSAEEISGFPVDTKIFTDGGCEPNPGEAGSGIAVYRDNAVSELWFGLYNANGTNNTAELGALFQALCMAQGEIEAGKTVAIFCDSKYSIQSVTQWAVNWEKNGWKKKGGEIKNLQLIQDMFAKYQELEGEVQVLHVNGHVGIEGNELADRMSMLAIGVKDVEFVLYPEEIDVEAILATGAG